jgi:TolA-binding protein
MNGTTARGSSRTACGLIVLAGLTLTGCFATSQQMTDLRDDITRLQGRLNEMQQNQADLSVKMDSVASNMDKLSFELNGAQNRMSVLGQRMDDMNNNLSQRMGKLSEQLSGGAPMSVAPAPSQLYQQAYSDFSRGKYALAVTGFTDYLQQYPDTELSPQAQYYLGESWYAQEDWQKALDAFSQVEVKYPKSSSVSPARLKEAFCF